MSGDSHTNADDDFLDEDFVVEDLSSDSDDLEDLFEEAAEEPAEPIAEPAEDDLLFADHTEGLDDEIEFPKATFAEDGESAWDGEELDLESVGVDVEPDPVVDAAKEDVADAIGELLEEEPEFALESDADLELVDVDGGGIAGDGIAEFEQSGAFVLDDSDGEWAEELRELEEEAPTDGVAAQPSEDTSEPEQYEAAAALDGVELRDSASPEDDGFEAGEEWQPLPESSMDDLSEVDEVQRADDYGAESVVGEDQEFEEPDLEDIDGHDLYAEEEGEAPVEFIGGPGSGGRRWTGVLTSLAASLLFLGAIATVFARPQWFGLSVETEHLARVVVPRPRIDVTVGEPPAVVAEPAPEAQPEPENEVLATGDPKPQPVEPQPVELQPVEPQPEEPQPEASQPEEPTTPLEQVPVAELEPQPAEPQPEESRSEAESWPVARSDEGTEPAAHDAAPTLTRMGERLMAGELGDDHRLSDGSREGVIPGTRAFAQLHNGNYFIGRVKQIAEASITLRVDTGEVTLAIADIASITRLGSSDYEQLQKATKGFVRLTNNNRLVGGILSKIADDHIVLEFRKNRVMLPKSAIGEIVPSADDGKVRLGTTAEEDNWLRRLAERELGSGHGAAIGKPDGNTPVPGQPPK